MVDTINDNRIAIYLPSLSGGGAERVMVTLANTFVKLGFKVDLILAMAEGPYLTEVSHEVQIIALNSRRSWYLLPALAVYLRKKKPIVILAAMGHANVLSVLAKSLARVATRVIISERNTFSISYTQSASMKIRILLPRLMAWTYPIADGVIAVSSGVAEDLARSIKLPRSVIDVVYNPVVTDSLVEKSLMMPNHAWFSPNQPPVIVGMGRLTKQKDFPTLLRAFALLRQRKDVRLIILGQGNLRSELQELIKNLDLQDVVDLPGFVENPFAILKHASLFVLSSAWEGLPNALIQAMACGTPVVSTNCPSGPSEILQGGKWGRLVPVGNVDAMAEAMAATLEDENRPNVMQRAAEFSVDHGVKGYLRVMLPNVKDSNAISA
ncbi:MAG TPA: glycosyltransferase [Burkholderiaceae bacterium]|nr:glycosyltransferase [Burkholderiaceae bacterium]